jgi:MOSC domain-containing protein YiiM
MLEPGFVYAVTKDGHIEVTDDLTARSQPGTYCTRQQWRAEKVSAQRRLDCLCDRLFNGN